MKTYFKTFAIITLSLLLTNCRKAPNSSRLQKSYEEAVKLHQAGNLNDAVFHYQSTALQCQYYPKDSLTYWWKAMCGQGEIWKEKNFLDYAQSDFEAVQQFAVRHRLDTAEYIACRKLTLIALEQQDYSKAKAYALRAHQISIKTPMSQEVTENQENERILSGSAYAIAYEKNIPDTMYRQLKRLSANTSLEIQTIALKLLSLYEIQGSGLQTHLLQYLRSQNEFSNQRFQKFTDASEREKKQLIAERDTIAAKQKNTLFISLTIFTLLLGSSLYAMADHRRKHELDRIRLILNQKEQTLSLIHI